MKKFILIFSFCTLIAVAVGAYFLLAKPTTSPQFLDEKNNIVALPTNSKIYLHFWGAWCNPCLMELPDLDKYAGRKSDITIYAIHVGKQSLADIQMVYDHLQIKNLKIYHDPGAALTTHFRVHAFPSTIEVTSDFQEVKRLSGPQQWQYFD